MTPALYIVQADSLNTADKSVVRVNAKVEQEFEIIHSVSANLTPNQVFAVWGAPGLRVHGTSTPNPDDATALLVVLDAVLFNELPLPLRQ